MREEFLREQRRDTIRFWVTIASLIMSIIGVLATTAVAIRTIASISGGSSCATSAFDASGAAHAGGSEVTAPLDA